MATGGDGAGFKGMVGAWAFDFFLDAVHKVAEVDSVRNCVRLEVNGDRECGKDSILADVGFIP